MKSEEMSLTEAVANGKWDKARHLAAIMVAEQMEATNSPRETKALSISLMALIDQCEQSDVTDEFADTPLSRILAQARDFDQ